MTVPVTIEFSAPIRIESEMNARGHWRKQHRRFSAQWSDLVLSWRAVRNRSRSDVPERLLVIRDAAHITITLTRVAPRKLDDDNATSGLKHVRDFVAKETLAIDDGDPRLKWVCDQRTGPYGVEVRIEAQP